MLESKRALFVQNLHANIDSSGKERILAVLQSAQETGLDTASILLELGMDTETLVTALLRSVSDPVLSASSATSDLLLSELAKIDDLTTDTKTIYEAQNIRNMIFTLVSDIRVILIKLAEKLTTLRTENSVDEHKSVARECIDIYAPIAGRLGISWLKNELEDLSLKYLNRETYQQIKELVAAKRGERSSFLEYVQKIVQAESEAAGITVEVESRAKHFYSVYMKMRKRGISAQKIYDLSAIRVICGSVENCYTLLGIMHRLWKPVNGCLKDYIARPKPNGYQSLHTSVIINRENEEEGKTLEIQIRTEEMHQMAEHGVASHWLYKKGSSKDLVEAKDIGIVNEMMNWKQNQQSSGDFSPLWLEGIKAEILRKSIYVFTPQGKVLKLPQGATPIDFAYHVHTAVGERCNGAKANGVIIPLSAPLKNTQVIEILTSPSAQPHLKWLELAKSSKARSKIRAWLDKERETPSVEKASESKKKSSEPAILAASSLSGKEQLQAQANKVVHPLTAVLHVQVQQEKNLMVRFARCCNPITGDRIIGYVSRGRGIIIHREDCSSIVCNPEFENRLIEVQWDSAKSALVKRFKIEAKPSLNLISEIKTAIQKRQGNLIEENFEESDGNKLTGFFTIQVVKAEDLKSLIRSIRMIPGILAIQAVDGN